MNIIDITDIPIFVTNEEHQVYQKIKDGISKHELDEREKLIANKLVEKSAIKRTRKNGKPYYVCEKDV